MIGTTLSHFRIVDKIGEGGMGVVYRAEDTKLRREVALKVLPPDLVANEERRLRFLREARTAAAVNHPNIATIHEIDEVDGIVFIAMELVEGKTLRSLIHGRPMPIDNVLRIATEMAEGLAEAHKAHIIHRDLKPDNAIVAASGHLKILDFGLAKLHEDRDEARRSELSHLETVSGEMTREGRVLGTPAYMSPEQARGMPVDARSDLFAFGTTLYEMATGRVPFKGPTATDTLSAIIRDTPIPAHELNPDAPQELERIIDKCLEKDPSERYQHTDGLVVDLRHLRRTTESGVQRIPTPDATPTLRRPAPDRRKQWALYLGGAILVVVSALTAWWVVGPPKAAFNKGDAIIVTDFENSTGRPEFDTAVRDACEHMMSQSRFIDVIRGRRLEEQLLERGRHEVERIDKSVVTDLCEAGGCAGFLVGGIRPDGEHFRIEATLYHVRSDDRSITRALGGVAADAMLFAVHNVVRDLRAQLGESPRSLSEAIPPTTS